MAITFKETLERLNKIEIFYKKEDYSTAKKRFDELLEAYQTNQKAQACLKEIIQRMGMAEALLGKEYPLIISYSPPANSIKYDKYFDLGRYQALMPYCELAYLSEKEGVAEEHALKLSVLFDNSKEALNYILKNAGQNKLAMHDACLFNLPDVTQIDFTSWKKIIKTNLNNAMFCKLLHKIPKIDALLHENQAKKREKLARDKINIKKNEIEKCNISLKKLTKQHGRLTEKELAEHDQLVYRLSTLRKELFDLSAGITMKEIDLMILEAYHEYLLLKELPYQMMVKKGLGRKSYEKFLTLDRQNAGQNIPDIIVDGKEINYPGYYLMKMSAQDDQQAARAAYLGKLTNCCQSLSGEEGESCVIHGLTSPQGGFYVLCNGDVNNPQIDDPLLAQCWVWRSKSGALVFDSVERVRNTQEEEMVIALYERLAKQLVQKGHTDKVAVGNNSGIRFNGSYISLSAEKEYFQDYHDHHDSLVQVVLRDKNKPFYSYQKDIESHRELHQRVIEIMQNKIPLIQSPFLSSLFNNILLDRETHENLLLKIADIATEHKRFDELYEILYVNEQYVIGDLASQPEIFLESLESNQLFLSMETKDGMTPLHYAAKNGNGLMVRLLLDKGASATICTADVNGKTPLHYATEGGHEAVVQSLLKHSVLATICAADNNGLRPLHYAAHSGKKSIVRLLLDKGASTTVCTTDVNGMAALHYAAESGHESIVQLLLENGASATINIVDVDGLTPLLYAVQSGNELIVRRLLLEKGVSATINTVDNYSMTALHYAAESGHELIVQLLLDKGMSFLAISTAARQGMTPLHYAAKSGNELIVRRLLLENGVSATICTTDMDGMTPLHSAAMSGNESIVQLLLENGALATICTVGRNGITPLHYAVLSGNELMVRFLLENGALATINTVDTGGNTPLQSAARSGKESMVKLLLENGALASICAADTKGETPLHCAVRNSNESVVRLLLENGASASIHTEDTYGETPLGYVIRKCNKSMEQLLLDKGISKAVVADKKGLFFSSCRAASAVQIAEHPIVRRIANN